MSRTPLQLARSLAFIVAVAIGPAPAAAADQPSPRSTPIVVRIDDAGFHWADAGIGALAGAGGALALTGGAALVRSSRSSGTRDSEGGTA